MTADFTITSEAGQLRYHQGIIKGRGSTSNDPSRFLELTSEPVDDGWSAEVPAEDIDDPPVRTETHLFADRTRKLITTNKSPDIPFSQSINPYKGCEHGCIYCFARPTHAYLDLSPGLDFETRIFYKTDVRYHLQAELSHAKYQCSPLAMGTNTDPYQPVEKQRRVMREILETLVKYHHPVSIVTKSALILRDLDLLTELAGQSLVQVHVSVTTLSNELKTKLEPRTASPAARLKTIRTLNDSGVPVGAMLAPVIPFINDHELEDLVAACAKAGARGLAYILVRLPLEVQPLFEDWLQHHYPLKARRVMAAIRDTRGGKAYKSQWHTRMVGEGQIAQLIGSRFRRAVAAAGLEGAQHDLRNNLNTNLRTDLFERPNHPDDRQMGLF